MSSTYLYTSSFIPWPYSSGAYDSLLVVSCSVWLVVIRVASSTHPLVGTCSVGLAQSDGIETAPNKMFVLDDTKSSGPVTRLSNENPPLLSAPNSRYRVYVPNPTKFIPQCTYFSKLNDHAVRSEKHCLSSLDPRSNS